MNANCDRCLGVLMLIVKTEVVRLGGSAIGSLYQQEQQCPACGRRLAFSFPCLELPDAAIGNDGTRQLPGVKLGVCAVCHDTGQIPGPVIAGPWPSSDAVRRPMPCPECTPPARDADPGLRDYLSEEDRTKS